jgi:hypothetical protein
MNTPPTGIEEYLEHCFPKLVRPLMDDLALRVVERRVDALGGLYELRSGDLIVRRINDRGLATLELASSSRPGDFWDMELVAGLFEPPPAKGVRRLNLDEQAELLRTRWSDLALRFGTLRYLFTRKAPENLGHERAKALFGPGV